jgi:hypothetical protein
MDRQGHRQLVTDGGRVVLIVSSEWRGVSEESPEGFLFPSINFPKSVSFCFSAGNNESGWIRGYWLAGWYRLSLTFKPRRRNIIVNLQEIFPYIISD